MEKTDFEALRAWTREEWPAHLWPNWSFKEMACLETGENRMASKFMDRLQLLRYSVGRPLLLTSAYRAPAHSVERNKPTGPGNHARGRAVDISCTGTEAYTILQAAIKVGFTGLGVRQSGAYPFLHLDDLTPDDRPELTRPAIWSY